MTDGDAPDESRPSLQPFQPGGLLSVRTELWFAWVELAGEQEMAAASWRRRAEADVAVGRNPSSNMAQETKAAMASVSAAGAALESFGTYLHYFSDDRPGRGRASDRVMSQVQRVCPAARISPSLAGRVEQLFTRRIATLHYASKPEAMGLHPLGMNTTWVARTFTVETARAGVEVVADLLTAAFNPGTSPFESAEWDAQRCKYVGKKLRNRRTTPLDVQRERRHGGAGPRRYPRLRPQRHVAGRRRSTGSSCLDGEQIGSSARSAR